MKLSDILKTFLIFAIFAGIYFYSIIKVEFKNIQQNWPKYRCNPAIMPFAASFGHDATKNFTYCIQTMQGNYMSYLLTPIHHITNVLGSSLQNVFKDINYVRMKIFSLVTNIMNVVKSIFSVFINIMIEFQRMIIKIKDLVNKMVGILIALINIMSGAMMTGESIMAGPIGDTLNAVKHL